MDRLVRRPPTRPPPHTHAYAEARQPAIDHRHFARVRHPLYASTLALALGWTLWWHSPLALLLTLALAGLLHFKAGFEEACLRRQFPDYAAYAQRVQRFLPVSSATESPPLTPC